MGIFSRDTVMVHEFKGFRIEITRGKPWHGHPCRNCEGRSAKSYIHREWTNPQVRITLCADCVERFGLEGKNWKRGLSLIRMKGLI